MQLVDVLGKSTFAFENIIRVLITLEDIISPKIMEKKQ